MSSENERILITGAAGFIGSGLARSLAADSVSLVLVDVSEQGLIALEESLKPFARDYDLVLGNIADPATIRSVLRRYRPATIVHAAAYKHVVTLEHQLEAAIRNNALASFDLAGEAYAHGVRDFLLISTDKAVEPSSIMGAAKRAAELLTLSLASPDFRVRVLRLGNVLGSPGSVLPLFEQQMREQRPLTVTHPEAERWFFTLEETTHFIQNALQVTTTALLIPPLNEPRRILDLVRSLWIDADIDLIGLRPGEKLTEAFVAPAESIEQELPNGLKLVHTPQISREHAIRTAAQMREHLDSGNTAEIVHALQSLVPEYQPSETVLAEITP